MGDGSSPDDVVRRPWGWPTPLLPELALGDCGDCGRHAYVVAVFVDHDATGAPTGAFLLRCGACQWRDGDPFAGSILAAPVAS